MRGKSLDDKQTNNMVINNHHQLSLIGTTKHTFPLPLFAVKLTSKKTDVRGIYIFVARTSSLSSLRSFSFHPLLAIHYAYIDLTFFLCINTPQSLSQRNAHLSLCVFPEPPQLSRGVFLKKKQKPPRRGEVRSSGVSEFDVFPAANPTILGAETQ